MKILTTEEYLSYLYNEFTENKLTLDIVKQWINQGGDINLSGNFANFSAIFTASYYGYLDILEFLLYYGVNPNTQNINGWTPLHVAKNIEVIQLFLKYGANPNLCNKTNISVLFNYLRNDNLDNIYYLVKYENININQQVLYNGDTILINSYEYDINVIKTLLEYGANPNIQNKNGETILTKVCLLHRLDIVELLLNYNVDINLQSHDDLWTPIFYASYSNCLEIIKILLKNGANPSLKDKKNKLPLYYTINIKIKKEILNHYSYKSKIQKLKRVNYNFNHISNI